MAVRPAATVMVVRDAVEPESDDSALEVLMVRRNLQSDFVGGAYVFPGGAVDPHDGGPEAEAVCEGRSDREASAQLGLVSGGLAYWVAALRETFEEAGLLLADRPGGPPLLAGERREEARLAAGRRAVNAGRRRFLDLCRDERLCLRVGDVHYFAHWITPAGATRRYDTRFFVAPAPPGQEAAHDAGETIDDTWITPRRALEGHRLGAVDLILPTVRNLQAISRFATSAELLEAARATARSVPAIEPRLVVDGTGVRIMLPGDAGYEDAGDASLEDGSDLNDAIRAVSLAANQDGGAAGGGAVAPRGAR
jgi:8-oxo-dGTP pyrophosphatase MutT (NUDIX family)